MLKYVFIIFISFLIFGCSGSAELEKSWDLALKNNRTSTYEYFLSQYPDSKYSDLAREKLIALYESQEWEEAKRENTISGYEKYILLHSDSPMKAAALEKIDELHIKNNWNLAVKLDTKDVYKNFISNNPNSPYVKNAEEKIFTFEEIESWQTAESLNTLFAYQEYQKLYPNGKYFLIAENRIEEIKVILPEWNKTLKKNTVAAYQEFISKYPISEYSNIAREKIRNFESSDWLKVLNQNNIKSYKKFISDYPGSIYESIAEEKIIDLEVDKIFKGKHGILPPSTKISDNYSRTYSIINIYNDTKYTLTVRYSGAEKVKMEFAPYEKGAIELKNGDYRVTASVNASNVRDYAGTDQINSGNYNSAFYIVKQGQHKEYNFENEKYPLRRTIRQ